MDATETCPMSEMDADALAATLKVDQDLCVHAVSVLFGFCMWSRFEDL